MTDPQSIESVIVSVTAVTLVLGLIAVLVQGHRVRKPMTLTEARRDAHTSQRRRWLRRMQEKHRV